MATEPGRSPRPHLAPTPAPVSPASLLTSVRDASISWGRRKLCTRQIQASNQNQPRNMWGHCLGTPPYKENSLRVVKTAISSNFIEREEVKENEKKKEFLSNKEQEKHVKNNEWSRDKFPDEELKALVIRMVTEIGIRIYENRILTRNWKLKTASQHWRVK